jgi:phosphoesterase RecJ-like protein
MERKLIPFWIRSRKKKMRMNDRVIDSIIESFQNATNVLVTAHEDPDGDSLGSQLVMYDFLRSLGKRAVIRNQGRIPTRYASINGVENIKIDSSGLDFIPDLVLVLESTTLERVGKVKDLIPSGCRIINIDHHPGNSLYGDINLVNEGASSVAEVVYSILKQAGFVFTRQAADWLYTAILTDTGRFHFSSTTPESLRICAEMIEAGVNPREMTDMIYFSKTQQQMQVIGEVMSSAEVVLDGRLCALTLSKEMLEQRGLDFAEFEGIVDYSMYLSSITIGVLFKSVSDDATKISLRSRSVFDVSELARRFGGGGHTNAAGATIKLPIEKAKEALYQIAEEMLNHNEK